MKAEITYNTGRSCTVKSTKFLQGQTRIVIDPFIIELCRNTAGFAVRVLSERAEKRVMPVERPAPVERARPSVAETDGEEPVEPRRYKR
jgi:hypothetical protein